MRFRARFSKQGKVRFTSHRDVARIWERALRRAGVPVAYSGGFSPRPRLHFGLALTTAAESLAEYLDIDVDDGAVLPGGALADLDEVAERLDGALPDGMRLLALAPVAPGEPSLQECITSCTWSLTFPGLEPRRLELAVERALEATTLPLTRERKGRSVTDDLRPQLHDLRIAPSSHEQAGAPGRGGAPGPVLLAELGTQPRTVRPSELVAVLDPTSSWPEPRVLRISQWIAHEGGRREPLAAPPSSWACTEVRAS